MNTLTILVLAGVVWMAYVMFQTYTGMQKELREIRLKCIGTPTSQYQSPNPGDVIKTNLLGALNSLAKMSE